LSILATCSVLSSSSDIVGKLTSRVASENVVIDVQDEIGVNGDNCYTS
jgi:hypothetical protein